MKRQATAIRINKHSDKQMLLSAMLLTMNGITSLPAGAQSVGHDSYLPPEIIPVNSAINYTVAPATSTAGSSTQSFGNLSASPATTTNTVSTQPATQTAQEARQAIFNSLMGTNVYPQFSGQNFSFNPAGNMDGCANTTQGMSQTLCNQSGQSNLVAPGQFNNLMSAAPSQTQTLSGSVNTPSTSQPSTGRSIGGLAGLAAGVGMSGLSLANSGPGNIYSAGLLGVSGVNYVLHNGLNF